VTPPSQPPPPPVTPPVQPPPAPTASLPFDCGAGFSNWVAGWSAPKKAWCCQHGGKGCATVPPTGAPTSDCLVWGDPHIMTFDKSQANFYGEGIKSLVKSAQIHVQARYKATPFTNGLAATETIAVGGPFLKGHVLKVGPMENGQITWDNTAVLTTFPSTFDAAGLGQIAYNAEGNLVDSAQSHLDRHIVHMDFPSEKLHIQVMRWANHINVRISMPQTAGIDGHCGNFNADASDDTTDQIRARVGLSVVQGESLFRAYLPAVPGKKITVDDCPAAKRPHADATCRQGNLVGDKLTACVIDVCFGGDRYASQDSVY